MNKYDVVMLSYNNTPMTLRTVESMAQMVDVDDIRLIWIDNGSRVDHRKQVVSKVLELGLHCVEHYLPENRGFPKAVNLGIALSTAPYVVLLNDDVALTSGVFDKMADALEDIGKAMIAGTVSTTGWQSVDRLIKSGYKPGNAEVIPLRRDQHLAFFCTMLTRECIQKIGYLTEEVGMGFGEDDDYNQRVYQAKYERLLCLDAFVEHERRSTWKSYLSDDEIAGLQQNAMDVLEEKYGERVW